MREETRQAMETEYPEIEVQERLVVTTDTDGATAEEFTTYLLETIKTLGT